MKNKLLIIKLLFFVFLITNLHANNLEINSSEVKLNKKKSTIIFRGNVKAVDENNNILKSDEANYSKEKDLLNSIGFTIIEVLVSWALVTLILFSLFQVQMMQTERLRHSNYF